MIDYIQKEFIDNGKIKDNKITDENGAVKDINNGYSWTVNGDNGGTGTDWINGIKYAPGSKSVSNDGQNAQKLNWTVSLNTGALKNDISGYQYVDEMTSTNQKYIQDTLRVKDKDGNDITAQCTVNWNSDGKSFTVVFPTDLGENAKKEYQITYSTEPVTPLDEGTSVEVKNKGTFGEDEVKGATGISQKPKPSVTDTEKIEKKGEFDENTLKIKWTVTYTPPADGITDPVFDDRISQGSFKDGWDNGYQDIIYDEDSFVISGANDYALSFSQSEKAQNENAPGNDCATIKFSGTYNKPITISYTGSYVGHKGIQKIIYNHCKVNQKEASAEVSITIKNSIAKKGEYKYSQTDHTGYIEWTIYANIASHQASDAESGAIDYGGKTVTIKEYLPKGVEFVSAVCKKWDGWGDGSNGNNGFGKTPENPIIPTESNGALIFSIPDVHKDVIRIKITTKVAKLDPDANGNTVYYNKASWSVDGSGDLGEADTSVTITEKLLTKKGDVYKASETDFSKTTLEYTIEVNPHALLLNAGNNLELSDELPSNVNLVAGSVTITDANNKAILGASSALVNGKLLIEVPDATYAIVKYRVTPNLNGITPDDKGNYLFKAKNTVQLTGYGSVKATDDTSYTVRKAQGSLEGAKNSLTIVKYDAEDTSKKLENAKFKLVLLNLNGNEVEEVSTIQEKTNAKGVVSFDKLQYDRVYYYQEIEAPEGYSLDKTKYYFCIKSQGDSYTAVANKFKQLLPDATLELSEGGDTKDITNIRKSSAQIVATKQLTGADLSTYEKRNQLKFKLAEVKKDNHDVVIGDALEATVSENGEIRFPEISYTNEQLGEHWYKVWEVKGSIEDMEYDTQSYFVCVNVSYSNVLKKIETTVTYPKGTIVFKNELKKKPVDVTFGGTKTISGIDSTDTVFTFKLYETGEDYQIKEGQEALRTASTNGTIGKDGTGYAFDPISYEKEGTHYYVIVEENAGNGFRENTTVYHEKVVVSDGRNGKLETAVSGDAGKDKLDFKNEYKAAETGVTFGGTKTIEGIDETEKSFTFDLYETGEGYTVAKDAEPLQSVSTDGKLKKGEKKAYSFTEIKYTEETTKYYVVRERALESSDGFAKNEQEYRIKVTVTDNKKGALVAAVEGAAKNHLDFVNTYSALSDLVLTARKSMKVSSDSLGTFEFELSGDNIETQTVTNNEAGAITFAPIHYNLSDVGNTYTYKVREKAPTIKAQYENDGIKYVYDTTVYTVKVKVEDNGDGTLKLTKTVKIGEKDYTDPEMKFVNDTTKATITKVDVLGNQLSGVELEVRDKNNDVVDSWITDRTPHVITGKLILGETYKLVEKSAPAGYTLADPVEFTVSENDIDNKVEMKNIYSASGSLNLTAKKTLITTETPLAADQFTFELRDKDGTVLQTKTNDADGNVTFDEIKYNLVKDAAYKDNTDKKVDDTGEYQYTVNEVKGDAAGYTYDDTIYTINVTVEDAGNGTLTVTPVIHSSKATSEDATVTGMEFTNTYTTSGQIALGATKTLEGQTLEAEQFSFQATEMDADGKAVENGYSETVKNADGGAITFPIITYKESGTHYYQITEVKDEKPAYQYDESKYVVKVDVTDDNAGKLTAKVTSVTKNGEPVKSEDLTGAVTFTNTYSASADLELKAQKSMKVEAEQLGTFEFELKDADGKVIETVKNDEKGVISFSKLSYTEKDAGKTFTYTVNEKLPSEADTYVYDKTVYTVTVNVEDNRDGTLKLTTKVNGEDYTETAMKFVNDTTKVTISKVDDTTLKALAGAKLQVVDDQDKVVEEWTSDGTPHVLTAKLVLGKTYKLVEAEAPSGYEIAEPITFTVDADDTKNAVEMKDAMIKSKTAAIEITKELKLNDALAGAKDMTFYAALFADAEYTIPASDVKALEFKNASSSTVTFTNLDLGRTYYVSETDVTGKAIDSGMTPDEKVYVPVYPQGQAITVTEDGAKSSITFENQFSEWPDGFYKIATLNVTKKLLGADGNALESDEIFYAGIFDDKECTTLSTRTEKNILTLDLAGGSTVSESTQAVVIPDESFTLYVAETDAEGNLVGGTDGFRYAVTVENGNVLFDENNLNAEVTIINQEQPEATPTVTPEETITPTPTPGTSTGVKTGDDTPIGFYMALLFVAALAIEETTRRRRKKEQD